MSTAEALAAIRAGSIVGFGDRIAMISDCRGSPPDVRGTSLSDFIALSSAALDSPDARALAAFYADITGGRVIFENDAWATIDGPGGRIDFQTVPGYTSPAWPDPTSSIQMHLDFCVEDLAATEARVLAAGAKKFEFQPNSDHCFVFGDPVGHPFCLSTWGDLAASTDDGVSRPTAEIEALLAYPDSQRDHVLGILDGLNETALRRPVLPSGWTCLGLAQHLSVDIERFWFRGVVAGEAAVTEGLVDGANDAWQVDTGVPVAEVFACYRDEIATSQRDHQCEASRHRAGLVARRPVRRVAAR